MARGPRLLHNRAIGKPSRLVVPDSVGVVLGDSLVLRNDGLDRNVSSLNLAGQFTPAQPGFSLEDALSDPILDTADLDKPPEPIPPALLSSDFEVTLNGGKGWMSLEEWPYDRGVIWTVMIMRKIKPARIDEEP